MSLDLPRQWCTRWLYVHACMCVGDECVHARTSARCTQLCRGKVVLHCPLRSNVYIFVHTHHILAHMHTITCMRTANCHIQHALSYTDKLECTPPCRYAHVHRAPSIHAKPTKSVSSYNPTCHSAPKGACLRSPSHTSMALKQQAAPSRFVHLTPPMSST